MRFKVGDRVRIKSLDWYNENKDKKGNVYFEGGEVKPCFSHCMSIYCGQIMTISDAIGQLYDMIEDDGRFCWVDEMIESLVEDEMIDLTSIVMETVEEKTIQNALAYGYNLPDGYQFKDENGNIINATKIVLEKKSPKTDDIIKWLREHNMTKYIGVIYSDMCSITFDTEELIKDITEMIGDE